MQERKISILLSMVWFLVMNLSFSLVAAGAQEEVTLPEPPAPKIYNVVGSGAAELKAIRYPEFYKASGDDKRCEAFLKKQYVDGDAAWGLSGAPFWKKPRLGKGAAKLSSKPDYDDNLGLTKHLKIPDKFTATHKLLVTWTVRVEAEATPPSGKYEVYDALCAHWHGTAYYRFPGGQVKTRLYIKEKGGAYKAVGDVVELTIPDGGVTVKTVTKRDPTITGSYLITKDDFDGIKLPEDMHIQLRWYNDTCMNVKSPSGLRNLVITLIPISEQ